MLVTEVRDEVRASLPWLQCCNNPSADWSAERLVSTTPPRASDYWDPNTPKIVKTCPKKVCLVDASLDGGPRAKRVDRRASSGAFNQHAPFSFRNVKAARKCR